MRTKDFTIFTKMVKIAKDQNLEYKIFHSYHHKNATNNYTEVYKLVLCTNLFTVAYEETLIPENTSAIKDFLRYNSDSCVQLDFDIKINSGNDVELTNFR